MTSVISRSTDSIYLPLFAVARKNLVKPYFRHEINKPHNPYAKWFYIPGENIIEFVITNTSLSQRSDFDTVRAIFPFTRKSADATYNAHKKHSTSITPFRCLPTKDYHLTFQLANSFKKATFYFAFIRCCGYIRNASFLQVFSLEGLHLHFVYQTMTKLYEIIAVAGSDWTFFFSLLPISIRRNIYFFSRVDVFNAFQ